MSSPVTGISTVFVYGTLMRGQPNYRSFAAGNVRCMPAWLWGCLYDTGAGYPMLEIPTEHRIEPSHLPIRSVRLPVQSRVSKGTFYPVWGELFYFDDLAQRLPRLDALEDFNAGHASLYDRVLVEVVVLESAGQLRHEFAWCYVRGQLAPESFLQKVINRWSPEV